MLGMASSNLPSRNVEDVISLSLVAAKSSVDTGAAQSAPTPSLWLKVAICGRLNGNVKKCDW